MDAVATDAVYREIVRLSQHSLRLRAYLRVLRNNPDKWIAPDAQQMLRRLIKDTQLKLGEPVQPLVVWPYDRQPVGFAEAQRFLQRPELFDTENFQAMRRHADLGRPAHLGRAAQVTVRPEVRAFALRLLKLADERGVPLFVERGYTSPADQGRAYVQGLTDIPAREFPYCYGAAVLIGHAAERSWSGWTLTWLNTLADLAAAELAVAIGYGPERPGEFLVADADGVLCAFDGRFADPLDDSESARLHEFFSGGAWSPAETDIKYTIEETQEGIRYVMPTGIVKEPP